MQICSILCFSWSILVSLRSSVNELQQNSNASSREEYIPRILTVLKKDSFDLCGLLSVIRKQQLRQYNYNVHQSELLPRFQADFTSLAGISVAEVQTPHLTKRPKPRGTRRNGCFRRVMDCRVRINEIFNKLSVRLQYAGQSPYSKSCTVYRCVLKQLFPVVAF